MSTGETNRSKQAVKQLERTYDMVRESSPNRYISITIGDAADILAYIKELQDQLAAYDRNKIKVGEGGQLMARPELDPAINILQLNEEAHYLQRPEYFDPDDQESSRLEAISCEAAIKILWAVESGTVDVSHLFKEEV